MGQTARFAAGSWIVRQAPRPFTTPPVGGTSANRLRQRLLKDGNLAVLMREIERRLSIAKICLQVPLADFERIDLVPQDI